MNMMSENINELMSALSKAQGMMRNADKDKKSHYANYADLTSVWDACREALSSNGLAITQTMNKQGEDIILVTTLGHSSGQWMKSEFTLMVDKKGSMHALGSAITYARRYSLSGLVGVCPDDDDGQKAEDELKSKSFNEKKPKQETQNIPNEEEIFRQTKINELNSLLGRCDKEYVKSVLSNISQHFDGATVEQLDVPKLLGMISKVGLHLENTNV